MTATIDTEAEKVHTILSLARDLPVAQRHWIADLLGRKNDTPLPEHTTLNEAIGLYLLDACSLGWAAELAGVTRWDIQDRLKEWGIPIPVAGDHSAQEIDELAEQLEREGIL
jgi:predicted HTH domain antitoxin